MKYLLLVLVFCVAQLPALADSPADLFRKGDDLAKEKKYAEALLAWKTAYLEVLPKLRGLSYRYPVTADVLERSELETRVVAEIDKEYPDEEILADTVAYSAFGFFSPSLDLRSVFLNMLTEEIAGFYDSETKALYLVLPKPRPKKWWEKIVGGDSSGFDPDAQKVALVHEMSHALMDQHYDLYSLHRSSEADEDMGLAVTALVEGEATLAMMVDMGGESGSDLLLADPDFMAGYMKVAMPLAQTFGGGSSFRKAPLVLRETLLFPYIQGMLLCMRLASGADWKGVNRAFTDPPVSTEQVLHPEKYLGPRAERDEPVTLSFPEGCPLEEETWELIKENVLGELQIEILLRPKLGRKTSTAAAAGWDGDLFRVYTREDKPEVTCLVWASTWDTEDDAVEIEKALDAHFKALAKSEHTAIRRHGLDVILVVGDIDDALRKRIAAWARPFQREPKRLEIKRFETQVQFADGALERSF